MKKLITILAYQKKNLLLFLSHKPLQEWDQEIFVIIIINSNNNNNNNNEKENYQFLLLTLLVIGGSFGLICLSTKTCVERCCIFATGKVSKNTLYTFVKRPTLLKAQACRIWV